MTNYFTKMAVTGFAVIAMSTPAFAIDVSKSVTINAPINTVWDKIGGWCAVKDWHPAVVECKEAREGDDVRRTLSLDGGGEVVEKLTGENEKSYSYIIESSPLPIANYKSTLSVEPEGDDKTKVTWTGSFDAVEKPDDEVEKLIGGVYEGGLNALAADMNK